MTKRKSIIMTDDKARVIAIHIYGGKDLDICMVIDANTLETFEFLGIGKAMDKFDEIKQRFYEKNYLS